MQARTAAFLIRSAARRNSNSAVLPGLNGIYKKPNCCQFEVREARARNLLLLLIANLLLLLLTNYEIRNRNPSRFFSALADSCCRDTSASTREWHSSRLSARFFSLTGLVVADRYIAYLRYTAYNIQQFLYWRVRISVRYTGPHLATVLRALALTDRQSLPAYDRRISGLMQLINNNASCNNRVLGLLLGPSAGLYGIAKRSVAWPWRFVARRTAVLSRGRHIVGASYCFTHSWWQHGANAALPMQCPSDMKPRPISPSGLGIRRTTALHDLWKICPCVPGARSCQEIGDQRSDYWLLWL
jgi:hypothetical protein